MRTKRMLLAPAVIAAVAMGPGPSPATAAPSNGLTSFHGTVSTVSESARTFRIKRSNGASLTFRVTSATVFQRISFGGLTNGKTIEVKARKVDGRWTARKVEPGTADDHGSGGHGSDD
jgi:hypothetical protein